MFRIWLPANRKITALTHTERETQYSIQAESGATKPSLCCRQTRRFAIVIYPCKYEIDIVFTIMMSNSSQCVKCVRLDFNLIWMMCFHRLFSLVWPVSLNTSEDFSLIYYISSQSIAIAKPDLRFEYIFVI